MEISSTKKNWKNKKWKQKILNIFISQKFLTIIVICQYYSPSTLIYGMYNPKADIFSLLPYSSFLFIFPNFFPTFCTFLIQILIILFNISSIMTNYSNYQLIPLLTQSPINNNPNSNFLSKFTFMQFNFPKPPKTIKPPKLTTHIPPSLPPYCTIDGSSTTPLCCTLRCFLFWLHLWLH